MAELAELEGLAGAAAGLPGVERAGLERGELVVHARVGELPALMRALRDDPRFSCEQLMDLCGVDWPERDPRFDLVYNLLSVGLNHRVRVVAGVAEGEAAVERGEIPDRDFRFLALSLIGAANAIVFDWMNQDPRPPAERMRRSLVELAGILLANPATAS